MKVTDWESVSVIQAAFEFRADQEWLGELSEVHRMSGKAGGARAFLKAKPGRQDYVWDGSVRNWVWERRDPGPRWRAYASKRGLTVEVDAALLKEDALEAWKDLAKKVGLSSK
jgi:hypothetical protein